MYNVHYIVCIILQQINAFSVLYGQSPSNVTVKCTPPKMLPAGCHSEKQHCYTSPLTTVAVTSMDMIVYLSINNIL